MVTRQIHGEINLKMVPAPQTPNPGPKPLPLWMGHISLDFVPTTIDRRCLDN